ncbi:MAG: SEC-C motif domain [Geobacteraceae bacterium]|nr:MAG: SEC-C motif domain [Geobacteraceae bacterium]
MDNCPCGSNLDYAECCEPLIRGKRTAATAEELMRSRYSAYVKVETGYLFETTHPDHREGYDHKGTEEWAKSSEWENLEILATTGGGPDDDQGDVEFIARYREKGARKQHHELAGFKKNEGKWFFTDGRAVAPRPIVSSKVGRNDPCPCGSGAKYKKCCGK